MYLLKCRFLLLLLGVLGWCGSGHAAPFEDNMAQRTRACTACHGEQGRAGPDGYYPRLAGKPADYLYQQLRNFKEGRRTYPLMTGLIDTLSDAYLLEMAQYFSALDLPYPPARPSGAPADVLARGQTLATRGDAALGLPACAQCHGSAFMGVLPKVPALLGLPRDYLNAQLGAWQTGQRRAQAPDCMAQVARKLAPSDVNAVASWLSAQRVPANSKAATEAAPIQQAALPSIECAKDH
ncbi:MAG: hypothetical protein RLZZ573_666 [Pseudomonadota bacterium]|jgi:cytochrome c553